MRQAGRSLPEYRALRARYSILEICRTPELAAEVTLQPVRRLGVDAAILFSDIVVPLLGMGVDLDIKEGVGPVVADPVRSAAGVDRLRALDPEAQVPYVAETVRIVTPELEVPLIGFAGAPFTLACYLVEGGPSKDQARTRAFMHSQPDGWRRLMETLSQATLGYLDAQVRAGASAVQLFDSWVGALNAGDFRTFVLPGVVRIFEGLQHLGVPLIYFGLNTGELLGHIATTGATVIGADWRVPLDSARARTKGGVALQGNLDPALCLAPWSVVERHAHDVLGRGGGRGHIFNLGHGVLPQTDPDVLRRLVDLVHAWEPRD
jgi:uroporphyrinogen decarboxylase